MTVNDPTIQELIAVLSYDSETGVISWTGKSRSVGTKRIAWIVKKKGRNTAYIEIRIFWRRYGAHRLAWLITHGRWPEHLIDHINGNGLDNRIVNLREATHSQNQRNKSLNRNNKSGFTGVFFNGVRWKANIHNDGKSVSLGTFTSLEDAVAARREAEQKYGYSEWRRNSDGT